MVIQDQYDIGRENLEHMIKSYIKKFLELVIEHNRVAEYYNIIKMFNMFVNELSITLYDDLKYRTKIVKDTFNYTFNELNDNHFGF